MEVDLQQQQQQPDGTQIFLFTNHRQQMHLPNTLDYLHIYIYVYIYIHIFIWVPYTIIALYFVCKNLACAQRKTEEPHWCSWWKWFCTPSASVHIKETLPAEGQTNITQEQQPSTAQAQAKSRILANTCQTGKFSVGKCMHLQHACKT